MQKTLTKFLLSEQKSIHIMYAWVDENDLILRQLKTDSKSTKITAIPKPLELLFLKKSLVKIDAIGTQKTSQRK